MRPRGGGLRAGALLAALAALGACTPGPPPDCPVDWRAAGMADGAAGLGADRYAERAAACLPPQEAAAADAPSDTAPSDTAAAVPPAARAAFDAGMAEGRRAYCMPRAALELGRGGRGLRSVCPEDLAPLARSFNRRGLDEWGVANEVVAARQDACSSYGYFRSSAWSRAMMWERELARLGAINDAAAQEAEAGLQ